MLIYPLPTGKKITVWSKLDGPELDNAAYMSFKPLQLNAIEICKKLDHGQRPTDYASCYDFNTLRVFQRAETS